MNNKKEFVKELSVNMESTQKDAEAAMKGVFDTIATLLSEGEDVSVPKFGKFHTAIQSARTCRNPKTGDPIEVPEKRVPKFKASSVLKEFVLE